MLLGSNQWKYPGLYQGFIARSDKYKYLHFCRLCIYQVVAPTKYNHALINFCFFHGLFCVQLIWRWLGRYSVVSLSSQFLGRHFQIRVQNIDMQTQVKTVYKMTGDTAGLDQTGHAKPGQDRTGHDQTGHDQTGHDQTGHDKPGHDRAARSG